MNFTVSQSQGGCKRLLDAREGGAAFAKVAQAFGNVVQCKPVPVGDRWVKSEPTSRASAFAYNPAEPPATCNAPP